MGLNNTILKKLSISRELFLLLKNTIKTKLLLETFLIFSTTLLCINPIFVRFYVVFDLEEQPTQIDSTLSSKELRTHINQIKNIGNSNDTVYLRLYYSQKKPIDSLPLVRRTLSFNKIKKIIEEQGATIEK